jgi:hypothetical protein
MNQKEKRFWTALVFSDTSDLSKSQLAEIRVNVFDKERLTNSPINKATHLVRTTIFDSALNRTVKIGGNLSSYIHRYHSNRKRGKV